MGRASSPSPFTLSNPKPATTPPIGNRWVDVFMLITKHWTTSEDSSRTNQPSEPTGRQFKSLEQPNVVSSDSHSSREALTVWMQAEPGKGRPGRQMQIGYPAFLPTANIERDEHPRPVRGMSNRVQRRRIEREAEGGWR